MDTSVQQHERYTTIVADGVRCNVYRDKDNNWIAVLVYQHPVSGTEHVDSEVVLKTKGDPAYAWSPEARAQAELRATDLVASKAAILQVLTAGGK